ncbi:MAG: fimbrillin family protein [Bacteroidales bacterium]|nr:fimbrillin family protein [Bacteroidales bacterium]
MKKILLVISAALLAASCSSVMEKEAGVSAGSPLEVRFRISGAQFETKSASAWGFADGDTFGIFAEEPLDVTNALYTVNNGILSSRAPIHWLKDQTEPTAFFATHPYVEGLNFIDNSSVSVQQDQSTEENYRASDFQMSESTLIPAFDSVSVVMSHRFARLDFELSKALAAKVRSISVDGIALTMDLASGTVSNPGSVKAGRVQDDEGGELWSVILPPQKVNPTLTMTCEDGTTRTAGLKEDYSFEAGCRYFARVSVREDGVLDIEFSLRIFDWLSDDAFLEPYQQTWGIFRTWMNYVSAMTRVSEVSDMYCLAPGEELPDNAEFYVTMDGHTEYAELLGAEWPEDGTVDVKILPGDVVPLVMGGCGLVLEEGGSYQFMFDSREKTICLVPNEKWYLYDVTDIPEQVIHDFYYIGPGLTYGIDRLFIKPGTDMRVVSVRNGSATVYGGVDGVPMVPGEPYKFVVTEMPGVIVSESGFYSITLNAKDNTILFTLLDDGNATVEDVLRRIPDGVEVTVSRSTVCSLASDGFVLSDNGKDGLRVILSEAMAAGLTAGSVVTVSGVSSTVDGQRILKDATYKKLEDSVLPEIEYTDVSDIAMTSVYSKSAVPVTVRGTLGVVFDGNDRYYVTSPAGTAYKVPAVLAEELFVYGDGEVEVQGWYTGYSADERCHLLTQSELAPVGEAPDHGSGTMFEPFDVVGAWLAAGNLEIGVESIDRVYIKGRVLSVISQFSLKTGCASFVLSTSSRGFGSSIDVLGTHYLDDEEWTIGCYSLYFADEVVVYGAMVNEGSYRHTVPGKTYLAELNGTESYVPVDPELTGQGTREDPYNVAAAVTIANLLPEGMASKAQLYVKGVVTGVARPYSSGKAVFYVSDDRASAFDMELSGPYYLGAQAFAEGDIDIAVGDTVVVSCCPIGAPGSRISKYTRAPWLYRLNDVVKDYVASFELDIQTSFSMPAKGGVGTFHIRTNCDWTVKTDPWIEVEMDDDDPELAWLGVEANNTGYTRTGHVTFTYDEGRQTKVLTITQEPTEPGVEVPVLDFDPEEVVLWQGKHQLVTQDGGSIAMTDLANGRIDWNTVSKGYLVIYFGCDWNYESHLIAGFTIDSEGAHDYLFRTYPDPGMTVLYAVLTEERLEHLRGLGSNGKPNGGLYIIGDHTAVYAVTWYPSDLSELE